MQNDIIITEQSTWDEALKHKTRRPHSMIWINVSRWDTGLLSMWSWKFAVIPDLSVCYHSLWLILLHWFKKLICFLVSWSSLQWLLSVEQSLNWHGRRKFWSAQQIIKGNFPVLNNWLHWVTVNTGHFSRLRRGERERVVNIDQKTLHWNFIKLSVG